MSRENLPKVFGWNSPTKKVRRNDSRIVKGVAITILRFEEVWPVDVVVVVVVVVSPPDPDVDDDGILMTGSQRWTNQTIHLQKQDFKCLVEVSG